MQAVEFPSPTTALLALSSVVDDMEVDLLDVTVLSDLNK